MITLLTGARKNIGDFLIAEKSRQVISRLTGETEFLEIDRWKSFDDRLEIVNRSRAVFICGGPAYGENFYPGILPLAADLETIDVPVIPIGVGLAGMRRERLSKFAFNSNSLNALKKIHGRIPTSGVRDELTRQMLVQSGIANVIMTGCPVMYDFESFGKPMTIPTEVKKIVLTTPAGRNFFPQTLELARQLRKLFPGAEIVASFHRGIRMDKYTSLKNSLFFRALVLMLKRYDIESIDTSYDLDRIDFYRQCDLHVGYRVHAHVFFSSFRRPSFLLQEDTRGVGMSATLGLGTDVYAYDSDAVARLMANVCREVATGFPVFRHLPEHLENCYDSMKKVVIQRLD